MLLQYHLYCKVFYESDVRRNYILYFADLDCSNCQILAGMYFRLRKILYSTKLKKDRDKTLASVSAFSTMRSKMFQSCICIFIPMHFKEIFHYIRNCKFMPCPFTGHKMFWAGPNFLCQTKNLFTYCGIHKHFVPDKKMICIQ